MLCEIGQHKASLEGELLQLIRGPIVLVQENVVMARPACSLQRMEHETAVQKGRGGGGDINS